MSTDTFIPTAIDLLWAVHNPTQDQRKRLAGLPVTTNAVLVTLASAALLEVDPMAPRGPAGNSLLVYPAFIGRTLGVSEATVKKHLKSLEEKGLVTGRATPFGNAWAANGPVLLDNLKTRKAR